MSFWAWIAIAIALFSGVAFANSKNKTGTKGIIGLILFFIGIIIFLYWWFTK